MMKSAYKIELNDLDATARLAHLLGSHLQGGQFLSLCGDLGAGKTTLTRLLTERLGCSKLATSPTFALFQEYPGGRLPVFHADLYRVGSAEELYELGWEETLDRFSDGVVVTEWGDKFPGALPSDSLALTFHHTPQDDRRRVDFKAVGRQSQGLLDKLAREWEAL